MAALLAGPVALISGIGAAAAGVKALTGGKKPPAPVAPVSRDDAAAEAARDDEIRRRRGSAADTILGPAAGEAQGVTVKTLTGE
jgi:hypothetical protein